jgi:mRNA interferase HigB
MTRSLHANYFSKSTQFAYFCISFVTAYLMKVHLIKKQTIQEYARANARSRPSFRLWLLTLDGADWNNPKDIQETFGSTDLLGNGCDRVVFDIGGNNFRMICHYVFGDRQAHLFVCWIGTHAEYDKLCQEKKQYKISIY